MLTSGLLTMSSPESSHAQALVIFARAPRMGQVKTRLVPVFTPDEACEIHVALLGDVVERSLRAIGGAAAISVAWSEEVSGVKSGVSSTGPTPAIEAPRPALAAPAATGGAYSPSGLPGKNLADSGRTDLIPGAIPVSIQPRGDLGERMALVIQEKLRAGFKRVVILGSDAPTLPDDHLRAAFDHLRRKDVVIGPAEDGGYYLVGMTRLHPEIFMKIRWGTPEVLAVTRKRLKQAAIGFEELGAWHDVDTPADVSRLWKELLKMKKSHPEEVPPRTWSVLSRLAPGRIGR